jgi:hypothetical protein
MCGKGKNEMSNINVAVNFSLIREKLAGKSRYHLLIGNGFSIACSPLFQYKNLYEQAVEQGLSERAVSLFTKLGTNNFEGVMHLLENSDWVARLYNLISTPESKLLEDLEIIKETLVRSVANSHLENTGDVSEERKNSAGEFIQRFFNVFTTNYDLLLYWVTRHCNSPHEDGFRADEIEPDAPYVVFAKRLKNKPGIFYLHGALHLFTNNGELRKQCWSRTGIPLINLIKIGLSRKRYPLFVSEGSPEKKLDQIQRVGYLWYCLEKLKDIEGGLVIYGHSLGSSDIHILNAIKNNHAIREIYVGIHGDINSAENQRITSSARLLFAKRQFRGAEIERLIQFYQSETANVWG